ncbi:MAG: MoaD/ThiS family protein [Anaerolineaceae bacterium]|jgi:molybdopterin converting factor small subunit|nr:MAG: MoaD/ThiS family protein [Anaerolineaceae bacterium]
MMQNHTITIKFFSHLKAKAGVTSTTLDITPDTTIADLKKQVITQYPALETHLNNILILIDSKIAIDEDVIPAGCTVSFMTPIGGG